MTVDYIIVGQGIAGSILSYELLKKNKKILLIDNNYPNSSSRVAAGLFNPVTGRRMVHTWLAHELFGLAHSYYPKIELKLKTQFFHPLPLHYLFSSIKESNDLYAKFSEPEFADWINQNQTANCLTDIHAPLGFLELKQAGWCNVNKLLVAFKNYFEITGCYLQEQFNYEKLYQTVRGWEYGHIKTAAVIFCEGVGGLNNPWFGYLPFKPVKGEIITFKSNKLSLTSIVKQHYWIIPQGNGIFKCGATFDFNQINETPSKQAVNELFKWLTKTLRGSFEVINHQAAIRPTTLDRRPLLGEHATCKNLFIFNGLGSKGVSLAPYLASHFIGYLFSENELIPELNHRRFPLA